MKRAILLAVVIVVAFATFLAYAQEKMMEKKMTADEHLKASIMRGKALFSDPTLGTNGRKCDDCHAMGGTMEGKLGELTIPPFNMVNHKYPMYWKTTKKVMTLDQVINVCIMTPMEGEPLAWDDQRLADLAAYCSSVTPMKHETMEKKEMMEKKTE
jgi:cytochrome c